VIAAPCVSGPGFSFGPQMPLTSMEGGTAADDALQRRLVELACLQADSVRAERRLLSKAARSAPASAAAPMPAPVPPAAGAAGAAGAGAAGQPARGAVTAVLPRVTGEKERKKPPLAKKVCFCCCVLPPTLTFCFFFFCDPPRERS
jgi:hypothetical protein